MSSNFNTFFKFSYTVFEGVIFVHYFVNSNSHLGFVSYIDCNMPKDRFLLNSYPIPAVESIVKSIIAKAEEINTDIEVIHNCLNNSLEGVVLPQLHIGVINIPVYFEKNYCINYLDNEKSLADCKSNLEKAYSYLNDAIKVHDQWEKIYIENTDFNKLDKMTEEVCKIVVPKISLNKQSKIKDRFFGATTIKGAVDYCGEIINEIGNRYYIKGRPGSGKSTMLKKIINCAKETGTDIDVYHCAFDPKSIDMIVLKDFDTVVFDSTQPHEYFPDRESDNIIDIYKNAIAEGTDEKYENQLNNIVAKYRSDIALAVKYLNDANTNCDSLNNKYMERLDYKEFDKIRAVILDKCFCNSRTL